MLISNGAGAIFIICNLELYSATRTSTASGHTDMVNMYKNVYNMELVRDYDSTFYNLNYKYFEYCLRGICALSL